MADIDRSEINRALAKAIAYKQCGKDYLAECYAAEVVALLGVAGILKTDVAARAQRGILPENLKG
jgi:hypothetical protein